MKEGKNYFYDDLEIFSSGFFVASSVQSH